MIEFLRTRITACTAARAVAKVAARAYWAWWGVAYAVQDWVGDRFEWDRPSRRPWTWRMYRRWYAPGRLVVVEDPETLRTATPAEVLAVHIGPDAHPLDTWLQVRPYYVTTPVGGDLVTGPPVWVALADVAPADLGPFTGDALTDPADLAGPAAEAAS